MPLMHREELLVILSPAVSSPEQLKKIDLFRLPLIVERCTGNNVTQHWSRDSEGMSQI